MVAHGVDRNVPLEAGELVDLVLGLVPEAGEAVHMHSADLKRPTDGLDREARVVEHRVGEDAGELRPVPSRAEGGGQLVEAVVERLRVVPRNLTRVGRAGKADGVVEQRPSITVFLA